MHGRIQKRFAAGQQLTPLQEKIWELLTDEPQTAGEIALKLNCSTRSAANALCWMRSYWLAWDGTGWRGYEGGKLVHNFPYAPWYRHSGPVQWVKSVKCPVFRRMDGIAS